MIKEHMKKEYNNAKSLQTKIEKDCKRLRNRMKYIGKQPKTSNQRRYLPRSIDNELPSQVINGEELESQIQTLREKNCLY